MVTTEDIKIPLGFNLITKEPSKHLVSISATEKNFIAFSQNIVLARVGPVVKGYELDSGEVCFEDKFANFSGEI